MTYCLGILLSEGLILASDSRTNAGVDQIASVRKLAIFESPGERMIAVLSAGNLATTQAVVTTLRQAQPRDDAQFDLYRAATMFDAARMVGDILRQVLTVDGDFVRPYGDPGGTFLVGGQIRGEAPRIFQIYTAGNYVEALPRSPFLQIGETKYGKPILDRGLDYETGLAAAAKLAVLSFDATIRSNLSVAPPIDLLCYRRDSFVAQPQVKLKDGDPYFTGISQAYSQGLLELVDKLPTPDWAQDRAQEQG